MCLHSFVSILSYVNPYTSQDATPEIFSQVLDREFGVGSSYFPGNVSKLMDFLKGSLEVGKEAFDFLWYTPENGLGVLLDWEL